MTAQPPRTALSRDSPAPVALGATACLVGRATLYGLAMNGEAGVRQVINIIREEIDITMALTGVTDMESVRTSILYPPDRDKIL